MKRKVIIKIDPKSVEKNPNAGNTVTSVPMPSIITFKAEGRDANELMKMPNIDLTERTEVNGIIQSICGILTEQQFENIKTMILLKHIGSVIINVEQPYETFNHFPEPDYLFEYERTSIECPDCGSKFFDDELEISDDYEDTVYECPKCHVAGNIQIEYQSITEALKMMKNGN